MGKLKKKFTAEQEWSYKHDFPFEEVCGTYHVLAKLIAPRLRRFKALDKHGNAPGFKGIAEWNNGIQKMTDAFELLEDTKALSDEENKKLRKDLPYSASTSAIYGINISVAQNAASQHMIHSSAILWRG